MTRLRFAAVLAAVVLAAAAVAAVLR